MDDDLFKPKSSSKANDSFNADWEIIDSKPSSSSSRDYGSSNTNTSSYSNYDRSSANSGGFGSSSQSYSGAADGDAQKRFSNAKGISSDQFFNKDSDVRMWTSCSHLIIFFKQLSFYSFLHASINLNGKDWKEIFINKQFSFCYCLLTNPSFLINNHARAHLKSRLLFNKIFLIKEKAIVSVFTDWHW